MLENKLKERLPKKSVQFFMEALRLMNSYEIDTWDYQMFFNQILYDRYSILSYVNQTYNVGFGSLDSAHTTGENAIESAHEVHSPYPIIHPNSFVEDKSADNVNMINSHQYIKSFQHLMLMRFKHKTKQYLKKLRIYDVLYKLRSRI